MAAPAGAVAGAYIDEHSWLTPRTTRKSAGRAAELAIGGASLAQKKRYDRVRRLLDEDDGEAQGPGTCRGAPACVTAALPTLSTLSSLPLPRQKSPCAMDSDSASQEVTPLSRPPASWGEGILSAGCVARDESRSEDNGVGATASAHLASSHTTDSSEVKEWIRSSSAFEDFTLRSSLEPAAPVALAGGDLRGPVALAGGDLRGQARSSIGALIVQDVWGAFYVAGKAAGRCDQNCTCQCVSERQPLRVHAWAG